MSVVDIVRNGHYNTTPTAEEFNTLKDCFSMTENEEKTFRGEDDCWWTVSGILEYYGFEECFFPAEEYYEE